LLRRRVLGLTEMVLRKGYGLSKVLILINRRLEGVKLRRQLVRYWLCLKMRLNLVNHFRKRLVYFMVDLLVYLSRWTIILRTKRKDILIATRFPNSKRIRVEKQRILGRWWII
jgi:hypothetical protein